MVVVAVLTVMVLPETAAMTVVIVLSVVVVVVVVRVAGVLVVPGETAVVDAGRCDCCGVPQP